MIRATSSNLDTNGGAKLAPLQLEERLGSMFFFHLFLVFFFMFLQFVLAASIDTSNCTPASEGYVLGIIDYHTLLSMFFQ